MTVILLNKDMTWRLFVKRFQKSVQLWELWVFVCLRTDDAPKAQPQEMTCKHACITIPHPPSDTIWGVCACVSHCDWKAGCVLQDYTIYNVLLALRQLWWIWTHVMEMKYRSALCDLFSNKAERSGKQSSRSTARDSGVFVDTFW